MVLKSINPTTEDVVETFEEFSDAAVDNALQRVKRKVGQHLATRALPA